MKDQKSVGGRETILGARERIERSVEDRTDRERIEVEQKKGCSFGEKREIILET